MPAVLAIWNDRDDAIAEAYERWYVEEHIPERLGVPGFLTARRYEAIHGAPRFFTCYETDSPEVLASPEYLSRLASPTPRTRDVMASFGNMIRTACRVAYRSRGETLGGCVVCGRLERVGEAGAEALSAAAAAWERDPRVLGVQVWRAAPDPAHAATSEARMRPGGDRRVEAAVVLEVMREQDADALVPAVEAAGVLAGTYRLLGAWRAFSGKA